LIIVTSPSIPGKKIVKTLGLVKGNTIRARHIGKDILAAFRNIVGGEIHECANAVISMISTTSMISQGAAELMVLGTAVIMEDE